MVQVTFDTNNDSPEELQEALKILRAAVERRSGQPVPKLDIARAEASAPEAPVEAPAAEEEAVIDAPFLKITVKSDEHKNEHMKAEYSEHKNATVDAARQSPKVPTLHQLLHDESLTEEELAKMFGEQGATVADPKAKEHKKEPEIKDEKEDAYIEIIEYTDEKQ